MRLIDIEKLRGCAIIRPHNGLEVKVIESFSDKICHKDIPTAYDVDKVAQRLFDAAIERYGNDGGMGGELVVSLDDAIEIVKAGGSYGK